MRSGVSDGVGVVGECERNSWERVVARSGVTEGMSGLGVMEARKGRT